MEILLVEDDPIQIEWAKNELLGHNLAVVKNYDSYIKWRSNKTPDLVVTDLFVPKKDGEDPTDWGWNVFRDEVEYYLKGEIKGVALISNFEHHLEEIEKVQKQCLIEAIRHGATARLFGLKRNFLHNELVFVREVRATNTIVLLDNINWTAFPKAMLKGKIISPMDYCGQASWEIQEAKEKGEFTLLKPYKEVVSALLS